MVILFFRKELFVKLEVVFFVGVRFSFGVFFG